MSQYYSFDTVRRVWLPPASESFPYSDGDESEDYLLSTLKAVRDVSSKSSEILNAIRDWPSEYHLSPVRHNLLRSFEFKATDRILELGCGCGSITRYLGETGATVIAVEGSLRRAEITAERCRDLPNVAVYCENIANFSHADRFDYVTLIGVLEYAPLFIQTANPVQKCLEIARSFLADEGALILAIENQLGLKYFAGSEEDHMGSPFFGLHDLYTAHTPVTLGRHALMERLHAAGLGKVQFYYPFPDYKLPTVLLSESALFHPELRVADLLARTMSGKRGGEYRSMHEGLAWRAVAENQLAGELANSFLIFARREGDSPSLDWLAKSFTTSRRSQFWTETAIKQSAGKLMVRKVSLDTPTQGEIEASLFFNNPTDSVYIQGQLWVVGLWKLLAVNAAPEEVGAWLQPWLAFLRSHAVGEAGSSSSLDFLLPANFVDCTPFNLILGEDKSFYFIDAEWVAAEPVAAFWVVIRGFLFSIHGALVSLPLGAIVVSDFIESGLRSCGVHIEKAHWEKAIQLENKFQAVVSAAAPLGGIDHMLQGTLGELCPMLIGIQDYDLISRELARLPDGLVDVSGRIRALQVGSGAKTESSLVAEIERIKGSMSWRITAPLRTVFNLSRCLLYKLLR
ncbi:MAG TPA: methyltransferase domain-containing protein [Pseudomonas sp.]|nr:methyltransferase domain-containing protein [Pseudomonas sp.]